MALRSFDCEQCGGTVLTDFPLTAEEHQQVLQIMRDGTPDKKLRCCPCNGCVHKHKHLETE